MKHLILIIASLCFSALFYQQTIGLNLSLFSIITIAILWWHNKPQFQNQTTIIYASIYLVTAILVFIQGTALAIFTNIFSFFTLIGSVSSNKNSIYVQWINGFYTVIAGYFHRKFDSDVTPVQTALKKDIDILHWVKLIGIPLVFIIVFILLYKNGNPIFEDVIAQINFDFINLQWILMTVLGYFLFNNISQPVTIEPATTLDLNTVNILIERKNTSEEKNKKDNQLGTTLLAFLNLLIVFYSITDVMSLLTNTVDSANHLSIQVHNGINALIASIIIAILTILFFFRSDLNFYKKNKTIKNLTYLWIGLNSILIVLISIKNYQYVSAFGFTYKRLGVFAYLLMTFFGLITTFIKVYKIKNIWYLVRVNSQIAFVICMLSATINWDYSITKFNINNAKVLDITYLIHLKGNNSQLLKTYAQQYTLSEPINSQINQKWTSHNQSLSLMNWQEYSLENFTNTSKTNQ
ncbi:DUF4153 domain-containing protein [Psychroserpens sp. NJDZ02]|uniref:DUF4153 domain-containing protein n=1 Tax=Psychroserpens sp. NJDZ02 TaxID=2570561 RepID=UPI0010A8F8AB|nr:DUF4153 domain-containing protein [Psychroserpens sp. NJDZ02]QCE41850.1 DUF4173 domain-containing protein [Psychroserpens sp. NJDZ02]